MTPHQETLFSSLPPSNSLVSVSQTLEGLFELTRRPSRALDSPCITYYSRIYKDSMKEMVSDTHHMGVLKG